MKTQTSDPKRLSREEEAQAIADFCDYMDRDPEGCEVIYRDHLDVRLSEYQVIDAKGHSDGSGMWHVVGE